MSNPNLPTEKTRDHTFSYKKYLDIAEAICREDLSILKPLVTDAPTEADNEIFVKPPTGDDPKKPTTDVFRAHRVNLSGDPLISVLIRCHKSNLAEKLVSEMPVDRLLGANFEGDTAVHVAAAEGDKRVAKAMLNRAKVCRREKELVEARNKNNEIPLHKAVLYGRDDMFWMLADEYGSNVEARGEEGANVLHYAIMCSRFGLALDIAKSYKYLAVVRNQAAVTPLQLMVTTPQALQSTHELGSLDSIIYAWIPLEETMPTRHKDDEEAPERSSSHRVVEGQQSMLTSTKFPSNYATFIDLLKLTYIPVKWVRLLVFNILKQLFNRVESLEELKRNHEQAMKLISCLATYEGYWDFIEMGKKPKRKASGQLGGNESQGKTDSQLIFDFPPSLLPNQHITTPPHQEEKETQMNGDSKDPSGFPWNDPPLTLGAIMGIHEFLSQILKMCRESAGDSKDSGGSQSNNSPSTLDAKIGLHEFVSQILKMRQESAGDSKDSGGFRWNDSPLTLGAKMGLHEFVSQILKACPESANYTDPEGKNVLQVAIQNGHGKIVDFVESLTRNGNPVLPSWLLSKREDNTNNTILHFAAETTIKGGSPALQVQSELQWFERVKKLVPIDLWNSRNKEEMTAQELFTKKHEKMVLESRDQLREIGKTCSGLLAAVVFATSISMPQSSDNHDLRKTTAFKVFVHAYEIGLSCAATALVLFISLLTATYKEQEFRRSLPTKYFLAMTSFFMALLCLLVAFICNIYLSMYGGKGKVTILVGELIAVPVICFVVLSCRGCRFGIKSFFQDVWR